MTQQEHESICTNCGVCCYLAIDLGSAIVRKPELRCEYLVKFSDTETRCAVYGARHEVAKDWCQKIDTAIEHRLLPNDCPYVKDLMNYQSIPSLEESDPLRSLVRRALAMKPSWIKAEDWASWGPSTPT